MKRILSYLSFSLLLVSTNSFAQVVTDTLYVSQDAFVNSGATTTNYGSDTLLNVYHDTASTVQVYRSFLQFDFSSIPANAIVVSAKLRLVPNTVVDSVNHPIYISRCDTIWSESGIDWSNKPDVYTTGQYSFTHAQTQNTTLQEFNITNLVQNFVNYPHLNNGIQIRLQDETQPNDCGMIYYSSEHDTVQWRPSLEIKYIFYGELDGYITHCTNGNTDGTINMTVSGGSEEFDHYWWYSWSAGILTLMENGSVNQNTIDVSGMSPGLYLFVVRDTLYATVEANAKYNYYRWFIVAEEGDTTTINIYYNETYMEEVGISLQKDTRPGAEIYEDKNYDYTNAFSIGYIPPGPYTSYDNASLIKYQLDFDPALNFEEAEYIMRPHTSSSRTSTSTNSFYIRPVTSYWSETVVTWNTRPSVDSTALVTAPQTEPSGSVVWTDTLDLLPVVEYWQNNPEGNFGMELALTSYNQPAGAYRPWKDSYAGVNGYTLKLLCTVKPKIETEFIDSLDVGNILVNAPAAELPYTYILSYDTIPDMADMWDYVKDSVDIDSTVFFRGKSNTRNYTFENLPAEHYFIAIFDNNGDKIFDEEVLLTSATELLNDITLDDDTLKVEAGQGSGSGTLNAGIGKTENGGFEFVVEELGDIVIGFNYQRDLAARLTADFEYAIELDSSARQFFMMKSDSVIFSDTLMQGDIFRIEKENFEFIIYRNEFEMHRHQMTEIPADDFKIDIVFKGPAGVIAKPVKVGKVATPKPVGSVITQTECDQDNGSIKMIFNTSMFTGVTGGSYVIKDISSGSTVASGTLTFPGATIASLPVGDYKVIYTTTGTPATSWTQYFTIAQPVLWDFLDGYYTPIGSNIITTNSMTNTAHAISQNILQAEVTDGFATFKLGTKHHYVPWGGPYVFSGAVNSSVSIVESDEDQVIRLRAYSLGTNIVTKYIEVFDQTDALVSTPFSINTEGPFKIKLYDDTLKTYYNNSAVAFAYVVQGTPDDYRVLGTSFCGYIKDPFVDFCYGSSTSELCAELDYELDGNYYLTTNGYFCFVFNQEYNDTTITFNIYNRSNVIVATQADFVGENMIYGENRVVLDLTNNGLCLGKGYFVLEVINGKNEKFYLRFYNNYQGCLPVFGSSSPLLPSFD